MCRQFLVCIAPSTVYAVQGVQTVFLPFLAVFVGMLPAEKVYIRFQLVTIIAVIQMGLREKPSLTLFDTEQT